MNILEVEDMIKGMPDNALMQEAQRPSGQVPQFLVISELQRRGDMRKRFQAQQQQPQATVKDQIVMESMGAAQPQGIMAAQPQQAPQQMFSGGIIKLADGGFLGQQTVTGAGTVKSQIDRAIAAGADMVDLFDIFKNQPEAIQYLSSMMPKAEEPAPQYMPGMSETVKPMSLRIADSLGLFDRFKGSGEQLEEVTPTGTKRPVGDMLTGITATGVPRPTPEYSRDAPPPFGLPTAEEAEAYGASVADKIMSGIAGIGDTLGMNYEDKNRRRIQENIARGQGFDPTEGQTDFPGILPDFEAARQETAKDIATRYRLGVPVSASEKSFMDEYGGGIESAGEFGSGLAALNQFNERMAGLTDYESIIGEVETADTIPPMLAGKKPTIPELTEAMEVAKVGSTILDESSGVGKDNVNGANVQGSSKIQNQAITGTGLDLSDLIAESRKDALSGALVQLGAGIAGGDVSKGLSAAGQALTKGQQEAKAIAMKGKLAEYQAGREDLAREEKVRQFDLLFEQADKKIAAELDKAERVSKGQLLSFVADLVKEAAPDFVPEGQSREAVIQQLTQQLLAKYAPFLDVDVSGLAMNTGSTGAVSGGMTGQSTADIYARYGLSATGS